MVRLASTEILVHVSAPSRPCDDARYRSEAQGYFHFEVGCRHAASEHYNTREEYGISALGPLSVGECKDTSRLDAGLAPQTLAAPRASSPSQRSNQKQKSIIPRPGSQAVRDGPFGIPEDGYDQRGGGISGLDTGLLPQTPPPRTSNPSQSSSQEQKSTVSNQRPLALSQMLFVEAPEASRGSFLHHAPISTTPVALDPRLDPRRGKLQGTNPHHNIDVERTPAPLPRPRTAPGNHTSLVQESPLPRRSQSNSWETPPGVIPDSQPSLPHLKRPSPNSQLSRTYPSDSGASKRLRLNSSSSAAQTTSRVKVSSSPLPPPASPQPQPQLCQPSSPAILTSRDLPSLPSLPPSSSPPSSDPNSTTIHAPIPKTGASPFKTHLTPCLALLVNHLPLLTFYTRLQLHPPLRILRVLERGHWAFPIRSFSASIWEGFWTYLKAFIGEGRASWGVWCVVEEGGGRNKEDNAGDLEGKEARMKAEKRTRPSLFNGRICKLYCWGEIVPEIWLLLFVASHRQIKGCGAQWIDAGGEAVIQMK